MRIVLIYHKSPYSKEPRGGELSVRAIVEHLIGQGHSVEMSDNPSYIYLSSALPDLVLTWGKPALKTGEICKKLGIPLVLMVRFWRNIAPLPAGNLMTRPIDYIFTEKMKPLFDTASAIITNTYYSKSVIERWQPETTGKVLVSYVPILGDFEKSGNENGTLTIVTPEIYGETALLYHLSELMPDEKFLVVNTPQNMMRSIEGLKNVSVHGYMEMGEVWKRTKALLVPSYQNDICGTRRVTIEAFRNSVPVVAMDRCGMGEKVPDQMLLGFNPTWKNWADKIEDISNNYEYFQSLARVAWDRYDTDGELAIFEDILQKVVKKI